MQEEMVSNIRKGGQRLGQTTRSPSVFLLFMLLIVFSHVAYCFTLKMEAVGSSNTLVNIHHTTWYDNLEDSNLRSRHYENLRFCIMYIIVLDILYVQFLV